MNRLLITITLAVVVALGLAACADSDTMSTPASNDTVAGDDTMNVSPEEAQFNDADVEFAQAMIPHHEQAVEMADLALDPIVEAGPDVLDLATRIQQAQGPEIELMTGWLTAWGKPVETGMASMEGMMGADEMSALGEARGADFDRMWLEMMIRHHEGAVVAAEQVKTTGTNPEVMTLADQIITSQQAEIDEMRALLGG